VKTIYYLTFDSECSTCSTLATTIEETTKGKVSATRLGSKRTQELLDHAFPDGYEWQPYLITIQGDRITAVGGLEMAIRLGRILGPLKALHVYSLARQSGVTFSAKNETESKGIFLSDRRTFVKLVGGTALSIVLPFIPLGPQYRGYQCTAKCAVDGKCSQAGQYVTAKGGALTESDACADAKHQVQLLIQRGCTAKHCRCYDCKRV